MDAQTKGERAAQILANEVYQEAVTGAKQRLKDVWAAASDASERESLWHRIQAIDEVTQALVIMRDNGIFERHKQDKGS